jgi:hypothetical protein
LVNSFFEALSFFLRYRLPLGYISAVGVGGARRSQSPKINSASKKELTLFFLLIFALKNIYNVLIYISTHILSLTGRFFPRHCPSR